MKSQEIIKKLKALVNPKNVAGMARFGIRPKAKVLGVSMPVLRNLGKKINSNSFFIKALGGRHQLAGELWQSGIHEAKILASIIEESKLVQSHQMDKWVEGFDSWDICDQVCLNLFFNHPLAFKKILKWSKSSQEFIRRAGFALLAVVAFKNKEVKNSDFIKFFPLIKKYSTDERNFVKKAVNWALRQIGKRNLALNKKAIVCAKEIQKINSESARWIANDALRELESETVQKRLKNKK